MILQIRFHDRLLEVAAEAQDVTVKGIPGGQFLGLQLDHILKGKRCNRVASHLSNLFGKKRGA